MQQPPAAEAPQLDQSSTGDDGLPLMVTARVAGERLGMSTYHVKTLIADGELPATKIGGTLFIAAAAIRAYADRIAAGPDQAVAQ